MKLDKTQRNYAQTRTDHVVKFAATYVDKKGQRTLMTAAQGRHMWDTAEEAQAWIDAVIANRDAVTLQSLFGDPSTFQVRAVACYLGHLDPMGVFFDDDGENPSQVVDGVALALWCDFDANERTGVSFGMFPAAKMEAGEKALGKLLGPARVTRTLAVALMDLADAASRNTAAADLRHR